MIRVISKLFKSELLVENQLKIKERHLCKLINARLNFILVTGNLNLNLYIHIYIYVYTVFSVYSVVLYI